MIKSITTFLLTAGAILFFATKAIALPPITATDVACTTACISTVEIVNNAVTAAKIQSNAVTSAKILNGVIVNADIASTAAISPSKISGTAWTSTNDGSGTGLDADTLDGESSGEVLRNDQSEILTGDLEVVGNITLTGHITSDGDICIGQCS